MKLVFISNYMNHHQKFLSDALYKNLDGNYTFIATKEMKAERRNLGYGMETMPDYVKIAYSEEEKNACIPLINDADVVIAGAAPFSMLKERIRQKKIVIRYSERILKKGIKRVRFFAQWINLHRQNPPFKPIYLLCAGTYCAEDYRKFGLFKNRMYKFGYFPETKHYEIGNLLGRKKTNRILWCGRMISCKHPDDMVHVANRLRNEGYNFEVDFVGTGEMIDSLSNMVNQLGLNEYVRFRGAMKPEDVRIYMEEASIFAFTSDENEGWGAVLNEAMNSACAIVSSDSIGSVSSMIENNVNGLIYESGNIDELYNKTKLLLDTPDLQKKLGEKAYCTIIKQWNAEVASIRLLQLIEDLMRDGYSLSFVDGPCSPIVLSKK